MSEFARSSLAPSFRSRRGLTVIELICVIAIIGILIAQLVSAFGAVRSRANDVVSMSRARSHAAVLHSYANDYDAHLPFLGLDGADRMIVRGGGYAFEVGYFLQSQIWNVGLADLYYPGNATDEFFYPPGYVLYASEGNPSHHPIESGYRLSCAFFADSRFWRRETRERGNSQWRAVRLTEVVFTSDKALLSAWYPYIRNARMSLNQSDATVIAFADGGADAVRASSRLGGYFAGDGPEHSVGHTWSGVDGSHTMAGVRGRDRR